MTPFTLKITEKGEKREREQEQERKGQEQSFVFVLWTLDKEKHTPRCLLRTTWFSRKPARYI